MGMYGLAYCVNTLSLKTYLPDFNEMHIDELFKIL